MSGFNMTGTDPDPAKTNFQRADRDPNITRPGAPDLEQVSTAALPAKSGSATLGNIRPFYASDNVEEIDQAEGHEEVNPPAQAGNEWVVGRDRYANDGSVGQEFMHNPATQS